MRYLQAAPFSGIVLLMKTMQDAKVIIKQAEDAAQEAYKADNSPGGYYAAQDAKARIFSEALKNDVWEYSARVVLYKQLEAAWCVGD